MTTSDDFLGMRPSTDSSAPLRPRRPELATFSEVLDAAADGESWAFDRLYRELSPRLRRFAGSRGVDDPDGLVNEVLVEVFRTIPTFSGNESEFRGFVFHVARRRIIDYYRRQARRPKSRPLAEADEGRVTSPQQIPGAMAHLELESVLRTLNTLTEDQRDVLILRVVCDLSLAETAAALDKPITAIKALQRRGISALRRSFSREVVS